MWQCLVLLLACMQIELLTVLMMLQVRANLSISLWIGVPGVARLPANSRPCLLALC